MRSTRPTGGSGRILLFCAIAACLFVPAVTLGGIRSKEAEKGGEKAKDARYNGVKFEKDNEGDQELLQDLEAAFKEFDNLAKYLKDHPDYKPPGGITADGLKKCVKCLRDMLEKGRLEKETGTANGDRDATTEPGPIKEGEDCNPDKAAMNLNPEAIRRIMKDPRGSKLLA